ncbi:hypothetical protein ADINL_0080 [Nitrincola lacisaponensis]|uniref:Uncharacterized protein n=1 Tax=Nitrincola lacisaponensis TaxID=267850 RepID=A0A063Y8G9_9GAMM|nr:DUF6216 family protein [Nitrincola lacisaponensis]KDE41400.1 hypothetical protein ADINL_0080 [Nitrincola lacisaponensis]
MDISVSAMVNNISSLPIPLLNMIIILIAFLGLRSFFHYRTGTSYGFVSRLYALLAGRSDYQDKTLGEFWQQNKELERFNAVFNFKAKSLSDAQKLIKWFNEYDLDHKKFARLGNSFDTEKLQIQRATIGQVIGFILLGIALAIMSLAPLDLGIKNAALVKFKDETQWIWLAHDTASNFTYYNIFRDGNNDWVLAAQNCSNEAFSIKVAATETQLKTETIANICKSFTSEADAKYINELIKGQNIFLVLTALLVLFALASFTELFRRLTAIETAEYLAERKRIKETTGE